MTFSDAILAILCDRKAAYRIRDLAVQGRLKYIKESELRRSSSNEVLRVTLSRLKSKGLIKNAKRGEWGITKKGRDYFTRVFCLRRSYRPIRGHKKNMIISFDIPEHSKQKRDWLREELRNLGFVAMQKSVWFGAAPLPKDFIMALGQLELLGYIKFFETKETDII